MDNIISGLVSFCASENIDIMEWQWPWYIQCRLLLKI